MTAPSTPALVTRWRSYRDIAGASSTLTWPELFDELRTPREYRGDTDHPGWAPILCPTTRRDENVQALAALVLDYDGGTAIEAAIDVWHAFFGLLHTTRKHTSDAPRFRVVLPLSRHVTPAEHARLWAWAFERAKRAGQALDTSTRNPSRFWYLPGTKPGGAFEAHELDGEPVDVDATLKAFDARDRTNAQPSPAAVPPTSVGLFDRMKRARAYLARMPGAVSGERGHDRTWDASIVLVRGFDLPAHAALDLLASEFNPRCSPPWSMRELEHKVDTAERDARIPRGYLLEDDRGDWRSFVAPRVRQEVATVDVDPERAAIQDESAGEAPAPAPRSAFIKLSVDDVFAPLPPVPWLVEKLDICPGAPAMIAGYGYSRKTLAAQALALSVAAGRRVWHGFDARRGRVLHIDYEQGRRLTLQRYQRLAKGLGVVREDLEGQLDVVVLPPVYLDTQQAAAVFARELEGYDLAIVDSFRAAAPSAEENSSDVRRHIDVLTRAAELTGCTPLLLHHARKPSKESGGDARMVLRGSSGIYDACASVLVFSAEKGQPTLVQHEKARTSGILCEDFYLDAEDLEIDGDPRGALVVTTKSVEQIEPPERKVSAFDRLKAELVEVVRAEGQVTSKSALVARVRGSREAKFEALKELFAVGLLVQVGGEGGAIRVR